MGEQSCRGRQSIVMKEKDIKSIFKSIFILIGVYVWVGWINQIVDLTGVGLCSGFVGAIVELLIMCAYLFGVFIIGWVLELW